MIWGLSLESTSIGSFFLRDDMASTNKDKIRLANGGAVVIYKNLDEVISLTEDGKGQST